MIAAVLARKLSEIETKGIAVISSRSIRQPIAVHINDSNKIISLNYSDDMTTNQAMEIVQHEEIHLECGYLYSSDDCAYKRRCVEDKVDRELMRRALPCAKLAEWISDGVTIEDIADRACVTTEFVIKTLDVYNEIEEWRDECAKDCLFVV